MKKRILYLFGSVVFALGMQAQVINSFPYNEDFESEIQCGTGCTSTCNLVGDFENDLTVGSRSWLSDQGGTGSSPTGPGPQGFNSGMDHNPGTTTGKYLYAETSFPCSNGNETYALNSPYFNFSNIGAINLSYWYNMFGAGIGFMHLDVDTTKGAGAWIMDYVPAFTDNNQAWQEAIVDLTQFAGMDSVRVRWRYINGNGFLGDAALDDISIFQPPPVDFEALSFDSLASACGLGSMEQFSFSALSNGSDTLFAGDSIFANYNLTVNGVTSSVREKITLMQDLITGDTLTHVFNQTVDLSVPADYHFTLFMEHPGDTIDLSNDTIAETIISVPDVSLPYSENFENGSGGWRAEGAGITWELGLPAKPTIMGASSGNNAWVVGGLTTRVSTTEQSWLIGPCLDLSAADSTTYFIAKMWWDSYQFGHSMRLEYSVDSGVTWVVMGDVNDPNWYNRSFASGFPTSSDGWSGEANSGNGSGGYVTVSRLLDSALIGHPDAQIRFYFGSSSTVNSDGFAIDDVSIGTPDIADLGADLAVCDGYVIDPGLPSNGTFRWIKNGQLSGLGSTFILGGIDTASNSTNIILNYTDPLGFVSSDTVDIVVNSLPTAAAPNVTDVTCNGMADGTATVSAIGGSGAFSYNWSNGDSLASASNLAAGDYTVIITDDSTGCTTSLIVTINEPTALSATITSTDANCNGGTDGTATITGSGGTAGYTYLWSNGATTATTTGLAAGTYTVTLTDANSCTSSNTVVVSDPAPIALMFNATDVSCNGASDGLAVVTAGGGSMPYSFAWSNGGTGFVQTGLSQGTYLVTVTDMNNCSSIDSVLINEPTVLTAIINSTNVTCNGSNDGAAALTTAGGTAPYSYSWSNGASTDSIGMLTAGTYLATITDANNCSVTAFTNVTEPAPINTNITQNAFTLISNESGATYQWIDCSSDTAITGATNQSYTVLQSGDYRVALNVNGCVDTSMCFTVLGVGINTIEANQSAFSLYPNPTRDVFTIEVEEFNTYPLQIFDVKGALVEELTLQSKKEVIDISHLPNGVYHIRFGEVSQKLVVTQ